MTEKERKHREEMKEFEKEYPVLYEITGAFGWILGPLLIFGAFMLAVTCAPILIVVAIFWIASHIFAFPFS